MGVYEDAMAMMEQVRTQKQGFLRLLFVPLALPGRDRHCCWV